MNELVTDNPSSEALPITNILIVDDVPQNLLAMEALLQSDTLRILKATSGAEALELLLLHEVALALLDVQMPEMDGFTLAELMRGSQRTRDVPIIFLTASPNDPTRSFKGYESGAVDFLHKPLDPHIIQSKVKVFIELYQNRVLLAARNEMLEGALKLNETMIAVLTHDLRTPLTVVMLCADSLRAHVKDGPLARTVAAMEASTLRMGRMIGQLLDFSRIRSDILHLELQRGNLGVIGENVVNELRQTHPDRAINFVTEGSLDGQFDPDRLGQVFSNLIGNALQHGTEDTPVEVSIDGRDDQQLRLLVRNAGELPEALLPRIFEPFKGASSRSQGLGLGLYIVEQFARAHGGEATARNNGGHAEFEVRLKRRTTATATANS
ncbi:two-component system sensor histidine kinase/response regulator [Rhodanobacter sp. TND4EL1]